MKTVHDRHQFCGDGRLGHRMPCITDDVQMAVRSRGVQVPRAAGRAHHVVASLDDVDRNVRQTIHVVENEVGRHENPVREVMAFDACEGHGKLHVIGLEFR